jgi:hypothetical protein
MARSSDPQDAMAEMLADHERRIGELTEAQQEAQALFERLQETVDGLLQQEQRRQGYRPTPPPRWWQLDGAAREDALGALRTWVERVYRPCYERYAADLAPCWQEHPLCLFILDWLSELHRYLYLREERGSGHLNAMAEWHARLLPIAAEMMRASTHGCDHDYERSLGGPPDLESAWAERADGWGTR